MNLSHWFVPKVGIFYKHKEWADKVFKQIENEQPFGHIARICYSKQGSWMELNSGGWVRQFKASDGCKGAKVTFAIVEKDMDEDIINCIIRPCTALPRLIEIDAEDLD